MFYVKALAAAAVLGALLLGYNHYTSLLADMAVAQQVITVKTLENSILKESKDAWKLQAEVLSQAMVEMAEVEADSEIEIERLRDIQNDHDIGKLAAGRPGLIERRVNGGTARVFRMFEDATGPETGSDVGDSTESDSPGS